MFAPGKATGKGSEDPDPGLGDVLDGRDTSGGLAGGSLLLFGKFSPTNAASKNVATQSLGLGCDPGSGDGQKWAWLHQGY